MTDRIKNGVPDGLDDAPLELTSPPSEAKSRKRRAKGGVTIRLDAELDARVIRFTERFCRCNPGIQPDRRSVLVHLIHLGLDASEGSLSGMTDEELRFLADEHGVIYDGLDMGPAELRRYLINALGAIL